MEENERPKNLKSAGRVSIDVSESRANEVSARRVAIGRRHCEGCRRARAVGGLLARREVCTSARRSVELGRAPVEPQTARATGLSSARQDTSCRRVLAVIPTSSDTTTVLCVHETVNSLVTRRRPICAEDTCRYVGKTKKFSHCRAMHNRARFNAPLFRDSHEEHSSCLPIARTCGNTCASIRVSALHRTHRCGFYQLFRSHHRNSRRSLSTSTPFHNPRILFSCAPPPLEYRTFLFL